MSPVCGPEGLSGTQEQRKPSRVRSRAPRHAVCVAQEGTASAGAQHSAVSGAPDKDTKDEGGQGAADIGRSEGHHPHPR